MKKALCIGIDYYVNENNRLEGCTDDAQAIGHALSHNYDTSENFDVRYVLAQDEESSCKSSILRSEVEDLFSQPVDTVVLYYSGHGGTLNGKGYLIPSDGEYLDDLLSMETLLEIINNSKASNKIVILDCCYAGALGKFSSLPGCDVLPENTTILAASRANQTAGMTNYGSIFSLALYEALYGGAANILGEITPASVFSFIDRSLYNYRQRPVFKANLENFICLRKDKPSIQLADLKKITKIFYKAEYDYPLDPSYESDKRDVTDKKYLEPNKKNEEIFRILRKYASLNMVVPNDLPEDKNYMYWAAVLSTSCRLTPLGRYYWKLVKEEII